MPFMVQRKRASVTAVHAIAASALAASAEDAGNVWAAITEAIGTACIMWVAMK